MKYKVAIATKDGKVIYEHFGHCGRYCIVEVEGKHYRFTGFREVEPPCQGGEHTEAALEKAAELLQDCRCIIVGQIGMGAQQVLEEHRILAYVFKGLVEEALSNIIHSISGDVVLGGSQAEI